MWLQAVSGGAVEALAFAPDGRVLYTADGGGTVTAWDTKSRRGRKLFRLPRGPDTRSGLFVAGAGRFLVLRLNPPVVWDLKGDEEYARLPGGSAAPLDLRPDPRDDSRILFIPDSQRSVATWDARTKAPGPVHDGWTRAAPLRSFDVAADGRTAALVDGFGLAILYDLEARREVARFDLPVGTERVRLSPDGNTLVVFTGRQVRLWDVPSRADRCEAAAQPRPAAFAFHPTAPVFAAQNADRVFAYWSLETGRPTRVLEFALGRNGQSVAFSPDGKACAVGGVNKLFIAFDAGV